MEKMRYLLCLFLYALKEKDRVSINTLFRYVYIYAVSNDYLTNSPSSNNEEFVIDKSIGLGNYSVLSEAIQSLNESYMIEKQGVSYIKGTKKLNEYIDNIIESDRVKEDLNRILYFVGIISNYSEDVVLSIFYKEPNVVDATKRNRTVVQLSNNRLYNLLENFEKLANENGNNNLDKYDVFTAWLDFVFEEYAKGKVNND